MASKKTPSKSEPPAAPKVAVPRPRRVAAKGAVVPDLSEMPAAAGETAADRARLKRRQAAENQARELALKVAALGLDRKALSVEIIDVRGKIDYADYVVVMSGRSDRQVAATARHIDTELIQKSGIRCLGIEGAIEGAWALMDYGDVVVHIFHTDMRGYYDLEALWSDAVRVDVPGQTPVD